jgi:phage terminase large subunit
MLNRDISRFLESHDIRENITADSAEPKSIAELQGYGHNIHGVSKGRDSVVYGINLMNQNEIYVTSRSKNLKRELGGYIWSTDKEGNKTQKPSGLHPDAIDAARYILMETLGNPHKGKYYVY